MDKKQREIAQDLAGHLIRNIEADISELENDLKYKEVAGELNSQPLAKRYLDFAIAYCWAVNLACGVHFNVTETKMICQAVFDKIRGLLETHNPAGLNPEDYLRDKEELEFFRMHLSGEASRAITIGMLWDNILEKRFLDYNNVYGGSYKFFTVASRFYAHIFAYAPNNDFNSSVLTSLFAGFLSKVFTVKFEDPLQEEIIKYSKMIDINPGYAKAYYNRAVAYFTRQEYGKSWRDAVKAKELGYAVEADFLEKLKKALGQ